MKSGVKNFFKKIIASLRNLVFSKEVSFGGVSGKKGEDMAEKYLKKIGYRTLERNYVNKKGYRVGEIDIVMRDGEEIVFVEVKTRKKQGRFDLPPEMAVDRRKLVHLQKSAQRYLRETGQVRARYRFEIVGITYDREGKTEIRHVKHVFV